MRIKDILRRKGAEVISIDPEATLEEAIRTLVQHNIGSLIVRKPDGHIAGIITERDILRECARRCDRLRETRVREVMTVDLLIGLPDDDLEYVMGVMTQNRVRHLPVLDDGGLQGIISIGDVVHAHLSETQFENRMLKDYIRGGVS